MEKKHQTSKQQTSWGKVADWYSVYLETTEDSYQKQVILPNLVRLLALKKGDRVLDLACGQGFFTREWARSGATVVGADISKELVAKAKELSPANITYHATPAHKLSFAKDHSVDKATMVLAIQNIENMSDVFAEVRRVLTPAGRFFIVMMHPAFRVPKETAWGFDEENQVQYRRVDGYLSQSKTELLVHPGQKSIQKKGDVTISYHRSLQDFSKALSKNGLAIARIEEWISHKKSQKGPRQLAEDTARKEIPLFMMLEVLPI